MPQNRVNVHAIPGFAARSIFPGPDPDDAGRTEERHHETRDVDKETGRQDQEGRKCSGLWMMSIVTPPILEVGSNGTRPSTSQYTSMPRLAASPASTAANEKRSCLIAADAAIRP